MKNRKVNSALMQTNVCVLFTAPMISMLKIAKFFSCLLLNQRHERLRPWRFIIVH